MKRLLPSTWFVILLLSPLLLPLPITATVTHHCCHLFCCRRLGCHLCCRLSLPPLLPSPPGGTGWFSHQAATPPWTIRASTNAVDQCRRLMALFPLAVG